MNENSKITFKDLQLLEDDELISKVLQLGNTCKEYAGGWYLIVEKKYLHRSKDAISFSYYDDILIDKYGIYFSEGTGRNLYLYRFEND